MRAATAVLIVLTGVIVGAQQLERPPFYPPKEKSLRPLFPAASPVSPVLSLPLQQVQQPGKPQPGAQPVTPPRSGSVCLKAVPVDPSIDRGFVAPVPDTRGLAMRMIEMPPCVTPAPQPAR